MEIKTLVIFGFILVIASSGMFFYLNQDNLNQWVHQLNLFTASKKTEMAQIDSNIKQELQQPPVIPEDTKLKQELTVLTNNNYNNKNQPNPSSSAEVFVVSNNIFSKGDAPNVCRGLFNSEGATKQQLEDGYNNGANWCNYGWTADGNAYYPLQNETNTVDCMGQKGVNGGKMTDNKDYKLGAICYGIKPEEQKYTELAKIHQESNFTESELKMLEEYRKKIKGEGGPRILPFNNKAWSRWDKKEPPPN